jgi:predicted Zn-dependent peptidase
MNDMPILSIGDVIARIDAVGIEDVRELAREMFAAERLSVVGVGPDQDAFNAAVEPLQQTQAAVL